MLTIDEIKTYMKKNKITQIELSEKSGIPLQSLRHIFCGHVKNPRIDTMQAIENALGIKEISDDLTPDKMERDFRKIGLTKERYNSLTEDEKNDLLKIIEIYTKRKK